MTRLSGQNQTEALGQVVRPVRMAHLDVLGAPLYINSSDLDLTRNGQEYLHAVFGLPAIQELRDTTPRQVQIQLPLASATQGANLVANGQGQLGDNTNFSAFTYVPDPAAPGGAAFEKTSTQQVPNPDFSTGDTSGWVLSPAGGGAAVNTNLPANWPTAYALQLIGNTTSNQDAYAGGHYNDLSDPSWMKVTPGQQIYVSATMGGSPGVVGVARIGVHYYSAANGHHWSTLYATAKTGEEAAANHNGFLTVPPGFEYAQFWCSNNLATDTAGYRYFTNCQLVGLLGEPDTAIPIDAARDYLAALALEWVQKDGETATAPDYTLTVLCQDNDGNTTGTLTLESGTTTDSYAQLQDAIASAQWPAGTTQILPSVTITTDDGSPATVRVASVSLTKTLPQGQAVAEILADEANYRGRTFTAQLYLLDDNNQFVSDALMTVGGTMSAAATQQDAKAGTLVITVQDLISQLARPVGPMFTPTDQKHRRPNCSIFDHVAKLSGRLVVWMDTTPARPIAFSGGSGGIGGAGHGGGGYLHKRR